MRYFTLLIIGVLLTNVVIAQTDTQMSNAANLFKNDIPSGSKVNKELQFFAFYINQAVSSNMYPEASLFSGQLVGRLFGSNSSNTSDTINSAYIEQRLIPFFIYQPKLFNGKAILRASFEIDWTWGDQAYGMSANKGSAISADQVNIQTQNIELELIPVKDWYINLGLQRLFDTPYNPYRTYFDKMTTTGYRLAYWGTDGVGISVRRDKDFNSFKAGFYKLYENDAEVKDDVNLFELMYHQKITMTWTAGASIYAVQDRGKNKGGVSVFGQGLTSTLANSNGAFVFNLGTNDYQADIAWAGMYFGRNVDFWIDRLQLTGFVNYNLGTVRKKQGTEYVKAVDIGGLGLNLRGAYRYGQTTSDYVSAEMMYTSGDADGITNGKYSGVITGNTWGMPANIFVSSGTYLLFPHANVVNRYTPVISDISNMGYGVTAGIANFSKDIVPNRINAKVGGGAALSSVKPQNGGKFIGWEANAALKYNFGPFMSLELHGAYMQLGNFFDSNDASNGSDINGLSNTGRPSNPWTAFLVYKWLIF
ncbi:MAG TPA: hypothetical protein DCQ31_18355 [Bacteroidales bacterium]|nr:hypothetical protein [Bacteroidales bacterium]